MQRNVESFTAEEKIGLYQLAVQLFDAGKSHPQIVEILKAYIDDDASLRITDKAFKNVWEKLHEKAARMLAKGRLWNEVVEELTVGEPYPDVIEWLANDLYQREFNFSHAVDVVKKKFEIWGYLLIMGIIQLIRYFISPYNKTYFWVSMLIGAIGLCWGIWELLLNKKHTKTYRKYAEYESFKKRIKRLTRINLLFLEKKEKVLNVYCTSGYPELDSTLSVMKALQENGVEMIELGMPYSDPLADGPVIQASNAKALQNGMTIAKLFEQLKDFRKPPLGGLGVLLMGYMNPVLQYGFEKFCQDAAETGVDGLIIPDLPAHEFETEYGAIIKKHGLDFIFLVTPETSEERVRKLDQLSTGFLYAVSSSSTTGSENNMSNVKAYLQRLKKMHLQNPVLVGFGIKDRSTFETACTYADGAIIGSAYIKALEQAGDVKAATKSFLSSISG